MVQRHLRKIVEKTYYYDSESESESESDNKFSRFVFPDGSDEEWIDEMTDDSESESEQVSDSEDGSDYESETEPESDSEDLDEPKPYYGSGYRVYFDSHEDRKKFFNTCGANL